MCTSPSWCTARRPTLTGRWSSAASTSGAALTGAKVEYYAPQVFDVVEQARLMDAAIATKPDGIAVSHRRRQRDAQVRQPRLAADIPMVVLDSGEKQGAELGTTLYVGTVSEYDSGKKAGERLAKEGIAQGRLHQPRGRQCQPRRALPGAQ